VALDALIAVKRTNRQQLRAVLGVPVRSLRSLPLRQCPILVAKAEIAAGEPPLERSAQCSPPAPAVEIAAAFTIARIVDSLKNASPHAWSVAAIIAKSGDRWTTSIPSP
jgi:hypothetical protein